MSAENKRANNEGYNQLARVIQARAQDVSKVPPLLEFGVILGDGALMTNKFPIPIPKTDYHVCRQLPLGEQDSVRARTQDAGKAGDGTHSHGSSGGHGGHTSGAGSHVHTDEGPHVHDVLLPDKMRGLKPGDHVLVVWVDADPVVVDIIHPASEVM